MLSEELSYDRIDPPKRWYGDQTEVNDKEINSADKKMKFAYQYIDKSNKKGKPPKWELKFFCFFFYIVLIFYNFFGFVSILNRNV